VDGIRRTWLRFIRDCNDFAAFFRSIAIPAMLVPESYVAALDGFQSLGSRMHKFPRRLAKTRRRESFSRFREYPHWRGLSLGVRRWVCPFAVSNLGDAVFGNDDCLIVSFFTGFDIDYGHMGDVDQIASRIRSGYSRSILRRRG
jgi:hypothetical protein